MNLLKAIAETTQASQDHWEFWQLLQIVAQINPKHILEIGVDKGHSLAAWQVAFQPDTLIGIDITQANVAEENSPLLPNIIEADSLRPETVDEVKQRLNGNLLDFLFIDGDHTYSAVLNDFISYSKLVRPGGIIAFHDIGRRADHWRGKVDVCLLFDQLKGDYRSIEIWNGALNDNAPGIGVVFF